MDLYSGEHAGSAAAVRDLLTGVLTVVAILSAQPVWCAQQAKADFTDYGIPLSDLKIIKKKIAEETSQAGGTTKTSVRKPESKRQSTPADMDSWVQLKSVRQVENGVRLDFDELKDKITLVMEPYDNKVILQLFRVRYPLGAINIPLGRFGIIRARIGQHPDGTWVVFDTTENTLPQFEVLQDGSSIMLMMSAAGQETGTDDSSGQSVLLTRAALGLAKIHKLTPGASFRRLAAVGREDSRGGVTEVAKPSASPETTVLPDSAEAISIRHTPFSFVVAGKQIKIRAVISSVNNVKNAYCTVLSSEEGKSVAIPMTKVAGTGYTYEGTVPGSAPGIKVIRYSIIAVDSYARESRSAEFSMPVKPSAAVPMWQQ